MHKSIPLSMAHVAYQEREGSGTTIVFVHGNSLSSDCFSGQFESNDLSDYRLLALDLPGHGKSPVPSSPTEVFSIPGYAKLLAEFLAKMDVQGVVLVGHSLGGHIAIEALPLTDRISAIAMLGTPPVGAVPDFAAMFLPHPAAGLLYNEKFETSDLKILSDGYFNQALPIEHPLIQNLINTKGIARTSLLASIMQGNIGNEVQLISGAQCACLVMNGSHDALINPAYMNNLDKESFFENKVHYLAGGSHAAMIDQAQGFNSLLTRFIEHTVESR